MIKRNIGKVEAVVRLCLAAMLTGWVVHSAHLGMLQGLALLAAVALVCNSVFGRCYLWKWLGLSSCGMDLKTGPRVLQRARKPQSRAH
ncbi:MAG: hypothetical protein ACI87W_000873 [Halieaceae bacterium]|jgi:hypothetical protein